MPGFKVTLRAQEDLKNIGRYTEQQWGRRQRNIYLKALENRFYWLAESPQLGRHRTDVADGYYSFPQGGHVVFCLIGEQGIHIIGVPHKEMDIITYFLPD